MVRRFGFNPDWVIHPGSTLREWREDNHLPVAAAATACARMPRDLYEQIEAGAAPITEEIAKGLEWGTHIPATLWLNLERIFRAGLAQGKTWTPDKGQAFNQSPEIEHYWMPCGYNCQQPNHTEPGCPYIGAVSYADYQATTLDSTGARE